MWAIALEALHAKAQGLKTYERSDIGQRIEQGNPVLHMLQRGEREAQHSFLASMYGPGQAVRSAPYTRYYPEAALAHIELSGPIFRRADSLETSDAQSTGGVMSALRTLSTGQIDAIEPKRDEKGSIIDYEVKQGQPIRNVFFTFDGPGGEATQIDEAAKLIKAIGERGILTTGFVEGLCASAHYYMASALKVLIASRMSLTGSIGVRMGIGIPAGKTDEGRNIIETAHGRQYVEFVNSDSEMKNADPQTEAGMEYYQGLVESTAQVFIGDASQYRNIPLEAAREQLGHGRVMGATEARERNLVDDIGTFDEVFAAVTEGAIMNPTRSYSFGAA